MTPRGRQVAQLVNRLQAPGTYTVTWQSHDLASGVYRYALTVGGRTEVRKTGLLK